jgi:hypothetical protein
MLRRLSKTFGLAALALAAVAGPSRAQLISRVEGDVRALPRPVETRDLRMNPEYHRLKAAGRGADYARFRNAGGAALAANIELGRASGKAGARGLRAAGDASRAAGDVAALFRNIQLPTVGRVDRLVPVSSERLLGLQELTRAIESEAVPYAEPVPLAAADLLTGIALDNRWVLKLVKQGGWHDLVIYDRETGKGFVFFGDPHIGSDGNNFGFANPTHYGEWTAASMTVVLPKVVNDHRVVIFARSDGGDAANKYGFLKDVYVITDRDCVAIEDLHSASTPGAIKSFDPLFVYRALEPQIKASPRLYWDATTGELRTKDGDRTDPPPAARQYGRSVPSTATDPQQTLQDGDFRIPGAPEGSLTGGEVQYRNVYAQGLAAQKNRIPGVAEAGRAHTAAAKVAAAEVGRYTGLVIDSVQELEKLQTKLKQLSKDVLDDGLSVAEIEVMHQTIERLSAEEKAEKAKLLEKIGQGAPSLAPTN